MRRALVTGGAGFIGSHVVDALLAKSWSVDVLDNFDPFYAREVKERNVASHRQSAGFRLIDADIRDADALNRLLPGGYDVIVHLAARAGVRPSILDPVGYQDVNVRGTQNLLELARVWAVPQFVFASSSSVYGVNPRVPWSEDDHVLQPISPYASTKVSGELLGHVYSHLYGIRFIALRFFTVYGPRQRPDMFFRRVCERLLDGGVFEMFGSGEQSRSFTYVGDVVDASCAAMDRAPSGTTYNVGGGEEATMLDAIALLEEISGRSLVVRRTEVARGDMLRTSADVSRIREQLGWQPRTSLRDGLQAEWSWCSARVAAG